MLASPLQRAEAQVARLSSVGWKPIRNDIGVAVMAQVVAELSRLPEDGNALEIDGVEPALASALDRLSGALER